MYKYIKSINNFELIDELDISKQIAFEWIGEKI